jgi:hypothetical protein
MEYITLSTRWMPTNCFRPPKLIPQICLRIRYGVHLLFDTREVRCFIIIKNKPHAL